MMPVASGEFARQVARASALRGCLDPVYQVLSDHYTLMLQRLYPVWALVGPGLADPAHIEIESRTVMLDSDRLLGERAAIVGGELEAWRILVSLGAAIHEVFHAAHTKRWIADADIEQADDPDPAVRQLVIDRRLLEEPRMEAHGIRDHPAATARGRFVRRALRAAVADVIAPALTEAIALSAPMGRPVSRDLCATSMSYLQARTHCETVDPAVLAPMAPIWEGVLGGRDVKALDDLYARLVWVDDGDLDALNLFAHEYRAIVGPAPVAPPAAGAAGTTTDGTGAAGAERDASDNNAGAAAEATAGSLRDAMSEAMATARSGELEQLDEDVSLQDVLAQAAGQADHQAPGRGAGTGLPTGRMPDRGVNRPACPDEVRQAVQFATRLAQARSAGHRQISKRTPGGRFDARGHIRARAQRRNGQQVTSSSWTTTKQVTAPLLEPHVGLVIDTSGSMAIHEYALGPIAWILDSALQRFGGRLAVALFGNGCELLSDGRRPLKHVPGIRTGGGTAFGGDAIELVCEQLEMDNPRRPRAIYVLSDGGWVDTQAGVARIRRLREQGVPTIHLSIGPLAPLSVEADRICVMDDPATAMDIVAHDTIEALRNPRRQTTAAA